MNLVVGAGISGCTIARELAERLGEEVLVIDKRDHIGGNCYDYYDDAGILVPKYGPHFFHTNDSRVWEYVQGFSSWRPYEHRVLSLVDGRLVPVPVNPTTVNRIFGTDIRTEDQMRTWLGENTEPITHPQNSEQAALARVGRVLYEKMFRNYTKKQWEMEPAELAPEVMNRIPVRTTREDRYFTDTYQAMPTRGYTALFQTMLDHPLISLELNRDYRQLASRPSSPARNPSRIFFTGRIDRYFHDRNIGDLQYRSLEFLHETLDTPRLQEAATINYPSPEVPWTRITEPKLATGQESPKTTIIKEFPRSQGEPYYPVFSPGNLQLFEQYRSLAASEQKKGVFFVGRLAEYKYFNMDQAFANALALTDRIR